MESANNAAILTFAEKSKLSAALQNGDSAAFMNVLSPDKYKALGIGTLQNMAGTVPDFSNLMNTATFNFNKLMGFYSSVTTKLLDPTNFTNISDAFDLISELNNKQDELINYIDLCEDELQSLNVLPTK